VIIELELCEDQSRQFNRLAAARFLAKDKATFMASDVRADGVCGGGDAV
jgi:hypothetical protein